MSGYELGDPVTFTWHLTRRVKPRAGNQPGREWTTERWAGQPTPAPRHGIIVGRRTLSDGDVDYGWDEPTVYTPRRHFTAYLVAYALHRRPVFVLPEHLEAAAIAPGTLGECGAKSSRVIGRCGRDAGHTGSHRSVGPTFAAGWPTDDEPDEPLEGLS